MYRIGIDVGGTNTDAVIMQNDKIIIGAKSPTTEDVMSGVVHSLDKVLTETGISKSDITAVMIGTTHFTNANGRRTFVSARSAMSAANG